MNEKDALRQVIEIGQSYYISLPKEVMRKLNIKELVRLKLKKDHVRVESL